MSLSVQPISRFIDKDDKMKTETTPHILDLENYAFELLNRLTDEYNAIDENGSFAHAIQETNDPAKMQRIIDKLQGYHLIAMQERIPEKPEFPFGEFDNGNHWQGESMFQSRITLDEYLALDNYTLELSGAFRYWLGNQANGKRTAGNWDRLMWQWIEGRE